MPRTVPQTLPPEPLAARARPLLEQFRHAAATACSGRDLCADLDQDTVARIFASSEFIALSCIRHPAMIAELLDSGDLRRSYGDDRLRESLAQISAQSISEPTLAHALRQLRRREMVRIAWRDLSGQSDLAETMRDLSALADACIDAAINSLTRFNAATWGTPCNSRGETQRLVVIAMGKLGAGELNFSSDVDLILAYPEQGETRGGSRQTSNGEYFTRLGQQLVNALSQTTADGFVFRVDLRLRPFGDSGALALDFDAMEQYYQMHGREWERYAMIKARACAGDRDAGQRLLSALQPFVYRRYLDYSAFDSLRDMKQLIAQEIKRKGLANNIKLGPGGIREIEFIGQAFQLIRGGRQPALRERRIQCILDQLRDARYLPEFVVRELQDAYVFLRTSEHRIQEFADQQTHNLPADDVGRIRLAYTMGFTDWSSYEATLRKHMRRVHSHFEQVFAAPQTEIATDTDSNLAAVWKGTASDDAASDALEKLGFKDVRSAYELLQRLRRGTTLRALGTMGQQRMDQLIPLLLGAVAYTEFPEETLQRVLRLVEAVARRTTYLSLLVENPMALSQLIKLCASSPWIADLLHRHPVLLDELLDPRVLYAPPDARALRVELDQRMKAIAPDDLEQQMEALRQYKQANVLRVAAADIANALPLMEVSDHLSWIAEAVVAETFKLAWHDMTARHGAPLCTLDDTRCDQGFAVIAFGKLGGLELGYGSDLDLVFLYATAGDEQPTSGAKPVPSVVFFTRLGQRMIHIFTAHTPSGVLYDVDMRLRPSGASGLLVSSINAYAEYQKTKAWTWEHQALVRARAITGDPAVIERFTQIRHEILARPRDIAQLRHDVRDMRAKMRTALLRSDKDSFDLKQGLGGIVDIEFLVQFGVLAWAHEYPTLLDYPDNIRLLEQLGRAGRITLNEARLLSEAYRSYRARQHKLTLQGLPAAVANTEFADARAGVRAVWTRLIGEDA